MATITINTDLTDCSAEISTTAHMKMAEFGLALGILVDLMQSRGVSLQLIEHTVAVAYYEAARDAEAAARPHLSLVPASTEQL